MKHGGVHEPLGAHVGFLRGGPEAHLDQQHSQHQAPKKYGTPAMPVTAASRLTGISAAAQKRIWVKVLRPSGSTTGSMRMPARA